ITPSFIGLIATMLPGVRPSISLASLPTASTSPVFLLMATMEGSFTTMPLPLAYTNVLAVPRSMARSLENMLKSERRLWMREFSDLKPFFDIPDSFFYLLTSLERNHRPAFRQTTHSVRTSLLAQPVPGTYYCDTKTKM